MSTNYIPGVRVGMKDTEVNMKTQPCLQTSMKETDSQTYNFTITEDGTYSFVVGRNHKKFHIINPLVYYLNLQ